MDARAAAQLWATTWEAALATRDVEAIVRMQAVDGAHWASPFRAPYLGRDGLRTYLVESFDDETAPTRAAFAVPAVDGNRASVEYWVLVEYGGSPFTIAGCTVLDFDADGLVVEARDYSFVEPGHHSSPPGFSAAR